MRRLGPIARKYWFDLAIGLLACIGLLELAVRGDASSPMSFAVPTVGVLVLAIVARRRYPFGGPAAYWLMAAGIAFIDPLLLPSMQGLFPIGMAVAFLLGNLRDPVRSGIGLVLVVGSAATLVYMIPGHTTAEVLFVPLEFAISWLAGPRRSVAFPSEPSTSRVGISNVAAVAAFASIWAYSSSAWAISDPVRTESPE